MKKVKFSAFADLHYREGDWNCSSKRLDAILERAGREKVDFIMHCGDWLPVPHDLWPKDFLEKHQEKFPLMNHCLLYDTPIHAIVTVAKDGTIGIEGMEGGMFLGITREQTANEVYDSAGLPCEPKVLSAHFRIL